MSWFNRWFFCICIVVSILALTHTSFMAIDRAERAERALDLCTLSLSASADALGVKP